MTEKLKDVFGVNDEYSKKIHYQFVNPAKKWAKIFFVLTTSFIVLTQIAIIVGSFTVRRTVKTNINTLYTNGKINNPDIIYDITDKFLLEMNLRVFLLYVSIFMIVSIFLLFFYYAFKKLTIAIFKFIAQTPYEKRILTSIRARGLSEKTTGQLQKFVVIFAPILMLSFLILIILKLFSKIHIDSMLVIQSTINTFLIFLIFVALFYSFNYFKRYAKLKKSKIILIRSATANSVWLFFFVIFCGLLLYGLVPSTMRVVNFQLRLMNESVERFTIRVQSNMQDLALNEEVKLELREKYSKEKELNATLFDVSDYKNSIKEYTAFVPFAFLLLFVVFILIPLFIYSKRKILLAALSIIVGLVCAQFVGRIFVDVFRLEMNRLIISLPIASITYILSLWISMATTEN